MADETKDPVPPQEEEQKNENAEGKETSMEVDTEKEEKGENKKEEKAKEEEKEAEEEEDEDDEDSDEEQVGLLERPVVIEDGRKRERKKVERMTFQSPESEKEKKFEIEKGKGTALADIPFIEFKINRTKAEELKPLYRILFKKVGKVSEAKRHIRKFSGFTFSKDDAEYEKRMQMLKAKSFTLAMIKNVCEVLDVARSGTKDEIIDRLMDFLWKPEDTGRKVPVKRKKGKKQKVKTEKKAKKEKKEKKTKSKSDDEEEDDEEEEEEEDEKEESEDEADDSEDDYEEPPKKKAKKSTPKATPKKQKEKKTPAKAKPKKATTPKKKATPVKKKSKEAVEDNVSDISSDSDSDDEALAVKAKPQAPKGPPTNDELKDVIKKMLDNANLEEVTMKTVLKDVFGKYPQFDLSDRKDFIKNTVKQIIS